MAPRIEEDPSQLGNVRLNELEQTEAGLCLDVVLQCGDRVLGFPDQLIDDSWIDLDRCRRYGAWRHRRDAAMRKRLDEIAVVDDSLQRIVGKRIGSPGHL